MGPRLAAPVVALLVVGHLLVAGTPAIASGDDYRIPPKPLGSDPKVGPLLAARAAGAAQATALRGPDAHVDVVVEASDVGAAARAIVAAGGVTDLTYRSSIQARVPAGAVPALAASSAVRRIDALERPESHALTSEGAQGSGAPVWHSAGYTGAGVKIAVVDDGFAGYPARQSAGELPSKVVAVDYCGGQLTTGSDHGTAVAEIVHDMAPLASLYLICVNSVVSLGVAKDYVKANNIRIVNFSGGLIGATRGDGTGGPTTPEGIVADARASGILWVNSAGNSGLTHWSGRFASADGDEIHDFAPSDEGNTITVAAGREICVHLKWEEWPTASSDFDVYLFASGGTTPLIGSQRTSGTPVEAFCYTNGSATQTFAVVITRYSGATPRMDLFVTGVTGIQYSIAAGSIVQPATSPAAMSVGAVCWQGNGLATYSSQGPTIDGRTKPDIAGHTQVTSATYGSASGCSTLVGFGGTSASAPHVAGAAALVLQANPTFTATQLQSFLEQRSTDLGPVGKDNLFGAGVLALGTAPAAATPEPPVTAPPPSFTVYLPNITRMLGGRYGWHTPFIVQNVGTVATQLSVRYYAFGDGSLVATRTATVQPGRSYVGSPNDEGDLPGDAQFSVVITSVGAPVVAVVNQHQGGGGVTPEGLSYSGLSAGSTKVNVPLLSKLAGGWLTTLIMQNLGTLAATVTSTFVRLDGTGSPVTLSRLVQPGRSQFIDPRSETALANGAEYAVTIGSSQPIGVVANAHNDLPGSIAPMGDSYNGIPNVTATTSYAPYVPRNSDGVARNGRVVVQNAGTGAATPSIALVPFGGGAASAVSAPSIPAGGAWAFTPTIANGEYSMTISGGTFAVLTTVISPATAMFYTATSTTAAKLFVPNVTRSLSGGPGDPGWTTPILIQSAGATAAALRWYRFADGSLVTTQNVALAAGATTRVDPRMVPGLADNTQYAVVLESPGQLVAVVTQINLSAGDNAMIYKAFAGEPSVVLRSLRYDGAVPNTETDEYVELQNVGSAAQNMSGWKVTSARGAEAYTFGALTLQPGQTCRLYTNEVHPEWCSLSWSAAAAIWNNDGDRAKLSDPAGAVVSSIGYKGY